MSLVDVHFLPELVPPQALAGHTAVVLDVLRATTTIVQALAAGAREVIACLEVDEARRLAASFAPGEALLGGERHGRKIEGFDLGNSPSEYTRPRVAGRTIVFTTTNGTKAIHRCRQADSVLLGALVNLSAVAQAVASRTPVAIVCAGTRGQISREDVLAAGAIVDRLSRGAQGCQLNDQAAVARDAWRAVVAAGGDLAAALRASAGGRNLLAEGFPDDILAAAQVDSQTIVPRLDAAAWRIAAQA